MPEWLDVISNLGAVGVLVWLVLVQMPKEREMLLTEIRALNTQHSDEVRELTKAHSTMERETRAAFAEHAKHDQDSNSAIVAALNNLANVQGQLLVVLQQQTRWGGDERRGPPKRREPT